MGTLETWGLAPVLPRRSKILQQWEERYILNEIKKNPKTSATKIAKELRIEMNVSRSNGEIFWNNVIFGNGTCIISMGMRS